MARVLILAFDGLDYDLVVKWKLKNLMQKTYGTYSVSAEKYASPVLWSAFLTGFAPNNFNTKFVERKAPKILKKLAFAESIKKVGRKFFKQKPSSIKGKYKTIFDAVENPLPFNIFTYNELEEQFKLRLKYSLPRTVGDKPKSKKAYKEWIDLTEKTFQNFLQLLENREWNLAMTHLFFTDIIGHLFFWRKYHVALNYAYITANHFAHLATEILNDNDILLIASDHGMEKGEHTNHAFWSLNISTNWKPRDITSFYLKILEWTKRS